MTLARKLAITSFLLELSAMVLLGFVLASFITERAASARPVVVQTDATARAYSNTVVHGEPVEISVPSLGIDARVDRGYYDRASGAWSISEDAAYFATITDQVNSASGSTFIYGHNSDKIFGKLRQIKQDAVAHVRTANGYVFTYTLTGVENVSPYESDKLEYDGDTPRLVLQTCSGFWNQTRQLTYFTLTSYKNI